VSVVTSVLVGVDKSSALVVRAAADLAVALGVRLLAVHVERRSSLIDANPVASGSGGFVAAMGEVSDRCHLDCEVALADHPAQWSFEIRLGDPAEELASAAADVDAGFLVIGGRRRARWPQLRRSSAFERLLDRSRVPVVVVRQER
jgi:nucleotide-binding universal stress UspA family protein